jgi:beta-mannosidase
MKRYILSILLLVVSVSSYCQEDISNPSLDSNIIMFTNATLTNNKNINLKDIDLTFYVNTYKILQEKGIIDSIFVRDNEKQMAKIDSMSWTYSCKFKVRKDQKRKAFAYLNTENIDGNCKIYINKHLIRETRNSFMSYNDEVQRYLKKGDNKIDLIFTPKDSIKVRQRSPQYLYGWDWYPQTLAPKINAIYLTFEDNTPTPIYSAIQTTSIDSNEANMVFNIKFRKPLKEKHTLLLNNTDISRNDDKGVFVPSPNIILKEELMPNNSGEYKVSFKIQKPLLWFPYGYGFQYIYSADVCLDSVNNVIDTKNFGIRKVELIREKDSIGESFFFKVNNEPIFIKGANYIMTDKNKDEDIYKACAANLNMFRIWGGSSYGDDEFYDMCDKWGIMIWQDFPFACDIYPSDSSFLNNVKEEATQNIIRLSSHPSLSLFCGNNEIWEGIFNWEWFNDLKTSSHGIYSDSISVINGYNKIFNELLPSLTQEYCPNVPYIHSSPVDFGWGHKESLTSGDCHYWGVWWADSNFETYTNKVPRFMSEYGFQSIMNQNTAKRYCSTPYTKDNPKFAIHEKHSRGFELIDNRVKEWFGNYNSDSDYSFFSQATQQEALKIAIEAHRRNKPRCMGTMFWQFNEPYPCVGWGCLDYTGEEKPVYYTIAKAYQPIIFSIDRYSNKDSVKVYLCSDDTKRQSINYSLRILDNNDSIKYVFIQDSTSIEANGTKLIAALAYKDIKDFNPKTDYLWVEGINDSGDLLIKNYSFFTYPKDYYSIEKYLEVIFDYYFGDEEE